MLNAHKLKSIITDTLPALLHACLLLLHPDWAGEHLQDTSQQKFWVFDDMISIDVSQVMLASSLDLSVSSLVCVNVLSRLEFDTV